MKTKMIEQKEQAKGAKDADALRSPFDALVGDLYDERGRIDKILHLGAGCPDGHPSEAIKDFLENVGQDALEEIFGQRMPPEMVADFEDADEDRDEETRVFLDWIGRDPKLQHFLVLAEAQVDYSWGHTYCIYGYGQSLDEAVQACIQETQQRRKLQAAKAKKGGAK